MNCVSFNITITCVFFTIHWQVVEEKRIAVKESIHYSLADALEDDAMEADQEMRTQSELTAIPFGEPGAQFTSFAHYMRHLNDRQQHNTLKRDISDHLWRRSQIEKAKKQLEHYHSLFN
jgi:hypothetical protein